MYDDSTPDTCQITVIATGLDDKPQQQAQNKFGSQFSVKPQQSPVKPVQPGMGTRPYTPVSPAPTAGTKPVAPAPNYTGIHKPGNLRSNVEEKSLKIPDFLQKK